MGITHGTLHMRAAFLVARNRPNSGYRPQIVAFRMLRLVPDAAPCRRTDAASE